MSRKSRARRSGSSASATTAERREWLEPPFVTRIRLRARRHALWLRHLWASAPGQSGLSISHEEADRVLTSGIDTALAERTYYAIDPAAIALAPLIDEADAAVRRDGVLDQLRITFELRDAELDLLTLTAAVEVDPWLRRAFGYLHDDATMGSPTPWLAQQIFQWEPGTRIDANSALVRWRLARPLEAQSAPWSVTAGWLVDPFVVGCLTGDIVADPALGDAVRSDVPHASMSHECLYPTELATMRSFVGSLLEAGRPSTVMEIAIAGPKGAGKRTLAGQLCAELRLPLLVADAPALFGRAPEPAARMEMLMRLTRTARLMGAAIYWHNADEAPGAWRFGSSPALAVFGTSGAATHDPEDGVVRRTIRLPALSRATRSALWSSMSSAPAPPPVLNWPLLPSDIARAAAAAPAGIGAVMDACRGSLAVDAGTLATTLARPYVSSDLVLSQGVRRHLDEFEAQARLRWPVYEEWGFGRLRPMGRGISALFAGPSGTGKTMAAQVLARTLDMEIYRVDLAGIMSKYIGDTEKHLRRIFDACERANVVLFFDEADALFGRRTQVKDAHDRFANIEIDYLLQRMEQFDGIAVLATNRKQEIDPAFLRRVRFIVDFLQPGIAERRELWTRSLPAQAPNGDALLEGIDCDFLAERLAMTGADIKSTAIAAAFLAREEGVRIGMHHVMRAASRELGKRGVVIREVDLQELAQ